MAARGEAQADVEVSTLVVPAWRLRWRAPELALVLGERAVALASARRDEVDRLRAEALVVFASNRMGRGVRIADRALDALKAAEAASERETAWRLRVELADSARSVGAPLTGFAAVRPVLEADDVPPGLRATALVQASECLVSVGRGAALARALDEADHLYQADPLLDHDTTLLHRGLLRASAAGQHRRWGDLPAAVAAARDGLALLDRLKEAASDNGQVRGRLTVELVCALMDLNKPGEASEVGTPLLERPVRAPSANTAGWLRLALATRVHLPAGRVDQARDLLRDAADSAERHQLDILLAESLLALAHVHEVGGNLAEALANLRSAHAAERRRARAVYAVRARLAAEFAGVHRRPAGGLHDELAALLRTEAPAPTPASATPTDPDLAPEVKQQLRQWRPVQMHRNEGVRVKRSRRAAEDMTVEGLSAARAHAADRWRLVQPFGEAEGDPQPGGRRRAPEPGESRPTQGRPEHARSGQARPTTPPGGTPTTSHASTNADKDEPSPTTTPTPSHPTTPTSDQTMPNHPSAAPTDPTPAEARPTVPPPASHAVEATEPTAASASLGGFPTAPATSHEAADSDAADSDAADSDAAVSDGVAAGAFGAVTTGSPAADGSDGATAVEGLSGGSAADTGAVPAAAENEGGERSVPAAGLIAAAGAVRSGRRRAAREAGEEGEQAADADANVLDVLKAAGLLDPQRAGGRRRAPEADDQAAGPAPTTEAESVQWRVEPPARLRNESPPPPVDMFDSPTMVQPAVRDDVPPVGLGAAFVKGPLIPTARVPDPPDYPLPPVPDFGISDEPDPGDVAEQTTSADVEERPVFPSTDVDAPAEELSTPQPEPDQVPGVPEPDQVPPVPVPDPVPFTPSPEPDPTPTQFGPTGFLSAADVEHDDTPAAGPEPEPVPEPQPVTEGEATKEPFVTAVVVGGKTIDLPAIVVEPPPPVSDSPSATRASRRHKSDLSLAELLAEALVAYEDARREDEAAGRVEVDEDTVPTISPVGTPPPESDNETTTPIRRVDPPRRFDTWTLPES